MIGGIVGFTFEAENLCPPCTLKSLRRSGFQVPKGGDPETVIRSIAEARGIDFDDEYSYDSGDFPKGVTDQQCETELTELPDGERGCISDERCTGCGIWLILGEKSYTEAALTRWVRDEHELPQELARQIAGKLYEWGLSHPEFISSDNVYECAALFPHDWTSYRFKPGNDFETERYNTPDSHDDTCVYCWKTWEKHRFVCQVCRETVPAAEPHAHPLQTAAGDTCKQDA